MKEGLLSKILCDEEALKSESDFDLIINLAGNAVFHELIHQDARINPPVSLIEFLESILDAHGNGCLTQSEKNSILFMVGDRSEIEDLLFKLGELRRILKFDRDASELSKALLKSIRALVSLLEYGLAIWDRAVFAWKICIEKWVEPNLSGYSGVRKFLRSRFQFWRGMPSSFICGLKAAA